MKRPPSWGFGIVGIDATRSNWSTPAAVAGWGGAGILEFSFGPKRVDALFFGTEKLAPEDPRLCWFALSGTAAEGGPFPPGFRFSPYDRRALAPPRALPPFGSPFVAPRRPMLDALLAAERRVVHFAKAHRDFFACGRTAVLHALNEEGRIEWFATDDFFAGPADGKIVGRPYPFSLGPLLPGDRHGVVAGERGFATVAAGRPVFVVASFAKDQCRRDVAPCAGACGAPARIGDDIAWPVLEDGTMRLALRGDGEKNDWRFRPVAGEGVDETLGRPRLLADDAVVWVGRNGFLHATAAGASWHAWRPGFRAAAHLDLHLDVQGRSWQFGATEAGWAWAKISTGVQEYAPVSGYQVSGGAFTLQGTDFCRRPTAHDGVRVVVQAFDGRFAVPLLEWGDAALVALGRLPDGIDPDDVMAGGNVHLPGGFEFRLLSLVGHGLYALGTGILPWSNRHDARAFVFADHLFLASSQDTRCIIVACRA